MIKPKIGDLIFSLGNGSVAYITKHRISLLNEPWLLLNWCEFHLEEWVFYSDLEDKVKKGYWKHIPK